MLKPREELFRNRCQPVLRSGGDDHVVTAMIVPLYLFEAMMETLPARVLKPSQLRHQKVLNGQCRVCLHNGSDCTGYEEKA
jgi:hypothetical protein